MARLIPKLRALIPFLDRTDGYRRRLIVSAFLRRLERGKVVEKAGFRAPGLLGHYFVTTSGGVFLVSADRLLKVFHGPCYGMARVGDRVFFSVVVLFDSYVLGGTLPDPIERGAPLPLRILARLPGCDRDRAHQICVHDGKVAVADTARNRILLIDPDGEAPARTIHPFKDQLGRGIETNHNHLNSVFSCGESLLFCAYRLKGTEGGLGVIGDGRSLVHPVPHAGIHGVYVRGRDLWYGDTIGPDGRGRLVGNAEPYLPEAFSRGDGYWVRGAAGTADEVVVGHSKRGDRVQRFHGRGKLLICREGRVTEVEMPAGQIYDIRREDGRHFEEEPTLLTTDELTGRLAELHPDRHELELVEGETELPKNVVSGSHHLY